LHLIFYAATTEFIKPPRATKNNSASAKEIGIFPNSCYSFSMESSLPFGFKVGVRLPDWAGSYVSQLFEGFADYQRVGSSMALCFDQPSGGDLDSHNIDSHWKGDGLLVYRYSVKEARAWKKAGIPVVNLSAEIPRPTADFPRVTVDNRMLGELAYAHLAALGLRDFAYVHESMRSYSEIRLESFRKAVLEHGGRFHQIDVPASDFSRQTCPKDIERCMRDQVLALPRPCGILVKDDIAGVWTSRLLQKHGIRCPEDMPMLGLSNDFIFCHTCIPPLSSIPYPGRKIGFAAAELLDSMMRGKAVASDHWLTLPPDPVVARESTRHVVLPDKLVSKALNFLKQETSHRPVSVAELSQKMGISSEGLRLRFIEALGHNPKTEIEHLRCEVIMEQLRNTDDKLDSIAAHHGFAGAAEICRMIKRTTGKTPGQIRRDYKDRS